jgi:2-iminobutanoate/2-iminopropanoate deaminase
MTKIAIVSSKAPPAAGAYSHGIAVGEWLFLSGQAGIDPTTGALVSDDIEGQTEQIFRNIEALLTEAGMVLDDVVSCLVHLSDLSLFQRYNAVYEKQFGQPRPVRTTVGAQLLPGLLIEVTATARRSAGD